MPVTMCMTSSPKPPFALRRGLYVARDRQVAKGCEVKTKTQVTRAPEVTRSVGVGVFGR